MPFQKGQIGLGRPKGALNHSKREFLETLKEHNFNVAEAMLDIYQKAMGMFETGEGEEKLRSLGIAANMVSDMADRVAPKLKAMEIKTENKYAGMSKSEKIAALRVLLEEAERDVNLIETKNE
jgi:hypothetical protein